MGTCDDDRSQAHSVPDDEATTEDHEDTVDPQEEHQELWAESEGYTPLSDVNYSSMMVTMGPGGDSDSEDDADGSVTGRSSHGPIGTFFVNPSAFSTGLDGEASDEELPASSLTPAAMPLESNSTSDSAGDYQNIADKALSLLDEEYERTLRGNRRPPNWEAEKSEGAGRDWNQSESSKSTEQTEQELNDMKVIAAAFDERKEAYTKGGFVADWDNLPRPTSSTTEGKPLPPVDTVAVRKVVESLSQKPGNGFQEKFAKWQERQQSLPETHDLIPATPYKAFRKNTDKAKQATASLSRSATIAEALIRLKEAGLFPPKSTKELVIDVVGVDHVECDSIQRIQSTFRPIIRWIGAWKQHHFTRVHLRLVGRDLTSTAKLGDSVDLLTPQVPTVLGRAYSTCHSGVYHEWLEDLGKQNAEVVNPHLMIAFNAGIWGYVEWTPTILYLSKQQISPIPTVITAYTLEECQEDFEVIETALKDDMGQSKTLWMAERNPFGSKVIRETQSSSNEYRENSGWQGWLLGSKL